MRVALCQMNSRGDAAANEAAAEQLLREAAAGGADLAALPEVWPAQGSVDEMRGAAEPIDGPRMARIEAIARETGMWISAGSVPESDGDRVFNTSALVAPDRGVVATYRKIHLFDVEPPDGPPFRESSVFAAGDEVVSAATPFGRIGLTVCFDLRFPEIYRMLVASGAEVVLVPSMFRERTGRDHWEVLLRARAIEDQVVVIAAAQWGPWGSERAQRTAYGHSMIVDPWGRVLAEAPDGVGVTFCDVDLDEVRRVREVLPVLGARRLGPTC